MVFWQKYVYTSCFSYHSLQFSSSNSIWKQKYITSLLKLSVKKQYMKGSSPALF